MGTLCGQSHVGALYMRTVVCRDLARETWREEEVP